MQWGAKMAGAGRTRVLLFAKAPVPGRVKTRLVPALGEEGAAALAAALLRHAAREALAAGIGLVELVAEPAPDDPAWIGHLPDGVALSTQSTGDLGQRMATAAAKVLASGEWAVLIGADCPALDAECISAAAAALDEHDAYIIPATDGGYVLLALKRFDPAIFRGIAWSTASVMQEKLERFAVLGWKIGIGDPLADIDDPDDLVHLPDEFRSVIASVAKQSDSPLPEVAGLLRRSAPRNDAP